MKYVTINNMQCVPVRNIDTVYIHTDNAKKMSIYTVGGFTITNEYPTERECREQFALLLQILNEYNEG